MGQHVGQFRSVFSVRNNTEKGGLWVWSKAMLLIKKKHNILCHKFKIKCTKNYDVYLICTVDGKVAHLTNSNALNKFNMCNF